MKIIQIVLSDLTNGICKNEKPIYQHNYADKFFDEFTKKISPVVICGRKTLETFPNKNLPKRQIIVLSNNKKYKCRHDIATNIDEALELAACKSKYNGYVCIIGGGETYKEFINKTDYIVIMRAMFSTINSDSKYPNISYSFTWRSLCNCPLPNYDNAIPINIELYTSDYSGVCEDAESSWKIIDSVNSIIKKVWKFHSTNNNKS